MSGNQQLRLFSEHDFDHGGDSSLIASSPTLDLTAAWNPSERNLLVLRPPSQIVSKIHLAGPHGEKPPTVVSLGWKHDGQFLAVGWSDGVVRLMGLENSKTAHHLATCDGKQTRIEHIAWTINHLGPPLHRVEGDQHDPGGHAEKEKEDISSLPRDLIFLEVDTALPKISPLPSATAGTGEDAMVFTLRTGLEFLFQASKPGDYDSVNVMVVGTADGSLQLSIYDSFVVGRFAAQQVTDSQPHRLVLHASHPSLSTHCLVLSDQDDSGSSLRLVPMDLPFIASSPINLPLLSSKLTTLQKLLRYLKQCQLHMQVEWKNARELPARFLRSIQADLEQAETGPKDIVSALFHCVVTGHASEAVREWLVDSIGERGHKRWDKAVTSALEGLRSLVHENFLPALDRCSIILSRLKGLAQFYDDRDDIGFSVAQISKVMDIVACLSLVGHKILLLVMDELESFRAFSTWLHFTIDRLASSSSNDELTEKEAALNNVQTLAYIERYLTGGALDIYFNDIDEKDYEVDWQYLETGASLLEVLDKQLKRHEAGQASMKALPHVDFLVNYATSRSELIFKDIAEAMKRSVRFGMPIQLPVGTKQAPLDIQMDHLGDKGGRIVAAMSPEAGQVIIYRIDLAVVNGISSNQDPEACSIGFGDDEVVDVKFLNADTLVILCQSQAERSSFIITLSIHTADLPFSPVMAGQKLSSKPAVECQGTQRFGVPTPETGPAFEFGRMEVHRKSNVRSEIPDRVCLIGKNGRVLRSFTFPPAPST